VEKAELIWMNGEFVPWDEAKAHVLSHGLHYGSGVFEGIRCYETERGSAIFRHDEHLKRLVRSADLYSIPLGYEAEELRLATKELIRRNGFKSCYIRPIAFRGYGEMGLYAASARVEMVIAVWPWAVYLGEKGKREGIRATVSPWRRISPDSLIPASKASGQYLNSILAKNASAEAGYEEAILLDHRGFVCEGTGENVFIVRDGVILTPPHTASILDGVSRKSVIQIARDLGYTVVERDIDRSELYLAEEVFLTGTAAELVPVREIDHAVLGQPGEITRVIQAKFDDALHGRAEEYLEWLDFIEEPAPAGETAGAQPASGKVAS
jgi:branched-chain amino acid aminotransferase